METTPYEEAIAPARVEGELAVERLEDELATLAGHVNAATARWLELVLAFREAGGAPFDDLAQWLAYRCGVTTREAREHVRAAEALRRLPATRAAFARGELTFTKVRALTRVATPESEETLLDLAAALSASQLERALRAFRRVAAGDAGASHALEFVDYHWDDDGSLCLRARLPAEDGAIVVRALDAARERILERRREERHEAAARDSSAPADDAVERVEGRFEERLAAPRSATVEALVELARSSRAATDERAPERARVVVHVDAATLVTGAPGRSELEDGPVVSDETARRLGCDAETVAAVERDGLPLTVGRARRTVPASLRRLLEARDDRTCRWPGCDRRRHLDAHHRVHWAHGGETSLDNLVLLCWHHHRLVHEGGYAIEDDPGGGLRFRNRHGVLCPGVSRPPPGSADALVAEHGRRGLTIGPKTNRHGHGDPLDLDLAVAALEHALG